MKNIQLLAVFILLFVSCQKDDETFVPRDAEPQNITEEFLSETSVLLKWEDMKAPAYEVEYGITGFILGQGIILKTATPSIILQNLTPDTNYDYYIKAIYRNSSSNSPRSVRKLFMRFGQVVTEFRPTLSQMRIFRGTLKNLTPSPYALVYDLNSRLYTDYAHKQRIIAMPLGKSMISNGDGLPDFPEKTVVAKTFYYNNDERDLALGRNLIETRVMIKIDGIWEFGDYIWNAAQTDAVLNNVGSTTAVSWIDIDGTTQNANYKIPSQEDCFTCHQTYNVGTLIGPKLRSMNFDIDGVNQLQKFIDRGELTGVADLAAIHTLPNWEDTTLPDETRIRSYFDMNCAHCHSPGGFHTENFHDALNVAFETSYDDSHIFNQRYSILSRIQTSIVDYSMPYLGVTRPHQEALNLIVPFLTALD